MELIRASQFREFPPRLPEQPIFYPVLSEEYATQIARDWNTKDERSGFAGFVCASGCGASFCKSMMCRLWEVRRIASTGFRRAICPGLNANIVGEIEIVSEFHG